MGGARGLSMSESDAPVETMLKEVHDDLSAHAARAPGGCKGVFEGVRGDARGFEGVQGGTRGARGRKLSKGCKGVYGARALRVRAAAADGASASYVTVLADRGAAADLARASNAAVLTDGGAAAALARASSAVVLADARAPAFSAEVLFTGVRALLADRGHSPLGSSSYVTKVSAGDHSPCLCLRASHQLRPTRPQLV